MKDSIYRPVLSWIAEDGSELPMDSPRFLGYRVDFGPRQTEPTEPETAPDAFSDMVARMVNRPPMDGPGTGEGGSKVP